MEITSEINVIVGELLEHYKKEITATGHNASGELRDTASYKCAFNGKWFEVTFILSDYWKYLENGSKPHFPPIDAIERWVTVKRIIPSTMNGRVPTTRQLAFLIARGISKNGTQPTKLLQSTMNDSDGLITALCDVLIRQIEEEIKEEII